MAIKNKDGSEYKLVSPNILAQTQTSWDKEDKIILHNLSWDKILVTLNELLPVMDDSPLKDVQQKMDKVVEQEVKEPEPNPEEMPELAVPKADKPEQKTSNKLNLKNVVVMHCLPAVETRDELYDETKVRFRYEEKFTFESVVVSRGDLIMTFWTNIKLGEKSIVFPSAYRDGVKFGDYRWWKVTGASEKASGYLTEAVVSDYQPDFSD